MTTNRRIPTTPHSRGALKTLIDHGTTATAETPHLPPADAPLVTPDKQIFLRVTENDVHRNGDGGRVVLQGLGGRHDKRMIGAYLTLVFDRDEPMWDFPAMRADMEGTVYEFVLRETTMDVVPANPDDAPKPVSEAEVQQLRRMNEELQRRLEAATEPDPAAPTT